jgi:hypothetical protein
MRNPQLYGWTNACAVEVTRTSNGQTRTIEGFTIHANPDHVRNILADHFNIARERIGYAIGGDTATVSVDGIAFATAREL